MKKIFLLLLFFGTAIHSFSQFRVIGYVQAWGEAPDLNKIQFKNITHLNIAFVNPDSSGKLVIPPGFDTLIKTAHLNNVKVLASTGGGSHNPYYAGLISDSHRDAFVQQWIQFATAHELDGIDVDLEGDAIDKNYDKFIASLSTGLKPLNKLLTAAFATWNADKISTASLKKFDFINIMSYDQTGPWRPKEPGPHSSYSKAEEDLFYWINTRGFSKKKVNLGLPFYGYCFGTKYGESMGYGDIIKNFAGAEEQDVVVPDNGGIIHYNGMPIIKKKTQLALQKAGGVMIWQLLQDDTGEKSLLKAIHTTIGEDAKK